MTVIRKKSDRIRVAKIHTNLHAGKNRIPSIPIRNVDRIAQKRFVDRKSKPLQEREMNLVNMKRVQLLCPVFDDPVFHISLMRNDVGHVRRRVERFRNLSINRKKEGGRTIPIMGVERRLRKIKLPNNG